MSYHWHDDELGWCSCDEPREETIMNDIVVIEEGSPAFDELLKVISSTETYKISIENRKDGVAIKRNEAMWSPTLSTKYG